MVVNHSSNFLDTILFFFFEGSEWQTERERILSRLQAQHKAQTRDLISQQLRPWPEPKSRVGRLTDLVIHVSLLDTILWIHSEMDMLHSCTRLLHTVDDSLQIIPSGVPEGITKTHRKENTSFSLSHTASCIYELAVWICVAWLNYCLFLKD